MIGFHLIAFLCLGAGMVGRPMAASPDPQNTDPQNTGPQKTGIKQIDSTKSDAASRRARWNRLSKEEQAELLARHKRLEALSPEDRAELESRAKRVHREMAEIEASLTEEELAQLDKLGRKERRDALRKMVAERASVAAEMVRTRMTPRERKRIEAAKPEERAEMLRVLRKRELERLSGRLMELGKELGIPGPRLDELQARPHEEQRAAIVARLRKRLEREVAMKGLPRGLSQERWTRMQAQGDMGFLRGVERVRRRHPEFGVPAKQWERRQRRRGAFVSRLEALVEPSDAHRARFPGLKGVALQKRMITERRHRIQSMLSREFRLRPEVLAGLQALSPQEFGHAFGVATKLIHEGADVNAGLNRWLGSRERRRDGKGR